MAKAKFNELYPLAKEISLGSDGVTWGVWFKLDNKKLFHSIEHIDIDVEFETEIFYSKKIASKNPLQPSNLCLN